MSTTWYSVRHIVGLRKCWLWLLLDVRRFHSVSPSCETSGKLFNHSESPLLHLLKKVCGGEIEIHPIRFTTHNSEGYIKIQTAI